MTAREKLAKEHPEFVGDYYGGCKGCPHHYGYLPKLSEDDCANMVCRDCWDREIPEIERSASAMSESKKPRSILTFKDGHTEEIFYYQEFDQLRGVLFATESGIYKYHESIIPNGVIGLRRSCDFFKVSAINNDGILCFDEAPDIESSRIDKRIPYEYRLSNDDGECCGTIYALPDATESDIREAILKDLLIEYRKEGEEEDVYEE